LLEAAAGGVLWAALVAGLHLPQAGVLLQLELQLR
jgi:hypothetical protein